MNNPILIFGAVIIFAVLNTLLHKTSPSLSVLFSIAATLFLIKKTGQTVKVIFQGLDRLVRQTDGQAFSCLIRSAGILLLTDYVKTLCGEAGAASLEWCAGIVGRCLTLVAAWPLLEEICQAIWKLAG